MADFPPPFGYLQFKQGVFFGIAIKGGKPIVASVTQKNAIGWKITKNNDTISFEFKVNGTPVFLAFNGKEQLQKDPFYFQYTLFSDILLLSANNQFAVAYTVLAAHAETNRVPTTPDEKQASSDLLKQIAEGVVVMILSEIVMKLLKKVYQLVAQKIKDTLSQELGEQVGEDLGDSLEESQTEALGDEESAAGEDGLDIADSTAEQVLDGIELLL